MCVDGFPKMSKIRDTPATHDLIKSQSKETVQVDRIEVSDVPKFL